MLKPGSASVKEPSLLSVAGQVRFVLAQRAASEGPRWTRAVKRACLIHAEREEQCA
jgi:hypothetical protein